MEPNHRSEEFWVETNFESSDLNGQTVEFKLTSPTQEIDGIGIFRTTRRPGGKMHIEIVVTVALDTWKRQDNIFTLKQFQASRIVRHPNPSVAAFEMLA